MKKLLITGFSGFVSRHFLNYLAENHICWDICGVDINTPGFDYEMYKGCLKIKFQKLDLLDQQAIKKLFEEFEPDYILHLASFSSVAYSWKYPSESFVNNTNIFLNLLTAISKCNKKCRILSVGSSEEYGDASETEMPLTEEHTLRPVNPYAVARVAQEMLSKVYVDSYEMDIVMTRSFNHIGLWQDERFVIPSFIHRILDIKKSGLKEGTIETGDIHIIRDFVDVRDVVRAYYKLLLEGHKGEIYNVCSGKGIALCDIITMIAEEAGVKVHTKMNPEYVRISDNKIIIGSNTKIATEIGWKPEITLERTISDMVACVNDILYNNRDKERVLC